MGDHAGNLTYPYMPLVGTLLQRWNVHTTAEGHAHVMNTCPLYMTSDVQCHGWLHTPALPCMHRVWLSATRATPCRHTVRACTQPAASTCSHNRHCLNTRHNEHGTTATFHIKQRTTNPSSIKHIDDLFMLYNYRHDVTSHFLGSFGFP